MIFDLQIWEDHGSNGFMWLETLHAVSIVYMDCVHNIKAFSGDLLRAQLVSYKDQPVQILGDYIEIRGNLTEFDGEYGEWRLYPVGEAPVTVPSELAQKVFTNPVATEPCAG